MREVQRTVILDVLRETYRMTSVKCGCKEGECGACSVLMDGILVNSCCVAMGAAEGAEIMTLEGYRETERFAVINRAFGEVGELSSAASVFRVWYWRRRHCSGKRLILRRNRSGKEFPAICAAAPDTTQS